MAGVLVAPRRPLRRTPRARSLPLGPPPVSSARLFGLTGLRFVAAAVVLLHHSVPLFLPLPGLKGLTAMGYAGMGFFFVLSGFVLTWTWKPTNTAREFWVRRLARIYPLHLLMWALAGLFLLLTAAPPTWLSAVSSLLLLQAWVPERSVYYGMNSDSWSLSCELLFYLLFPVVVPWIARMRLAHPWRVLAGLYAVSLAVVGVVSVVVEDPGLRYALLYVNPAYRSLQFLAGMVLAMAVRRGWRPRVRFGIANTVAWCAYCVVVLLNALAVRGMLGPLGVGDLEERGLPRYIAEAMLVPFLVLVVVGFVAAELDGRRLTLARPLFLLLGTWSFALYLSHQLMIRALVTPFGEVRVLRPLGPLLELVVVGLAIGLAGLLYTYWERPWETRIRTWCGVRTRRQDVLVDGPAVAAERGAP